ncbi:MAG: type VII toxin-antitoxin system HepT family RNase toxin [bacterium]
MIDKERIFTRLEILNEYLMILKECSKEPLEKLKADKIFRGAVERYLQLAVECVIDVGEILISNLNLRKPEDARDVIDILGEKGIIPDEFAYKFGPITGFRNILVHNYIRIDLDLVYKFLTEKLDDFNQFVKYVSQYLLKSKIHQGDAP